MAVVRRHPRGKGAADQPYVRTVAKVIEDAGFEVALESPHGVFDLSFMAANGDHIAVECGSDVLSSDGRFQMWLSQVRKSKRAIKETLVVNHFFPPQLREKFDGYRGVEPVEYQQLPVVLERYKSQPTPKPPRISRTTRVASTVVQNKSEIAVLAEALAIQIDSKIAKLKDQKPNSPNAIAARDNEISDYEALKAQVTALQRAVAKLTKSVETKEQAAKAAMSFGDGVKSWWGKQHANILEKSAEMGVILSAVGLCSLVGVSPNTAMYAATALVGGKSVAAALKGIIKVNA
jgi:hypothetical protein